MDSAKLTCNPLTGEHCTQLDMAAQACALQDDLIDRCKRAGLPGQSLNPYIAENNRQKDLIAGIRMAFIDGDSNG